MNLLSIQNLWRRNTGGQLSANRVKQLDSEEIDGMVSNPDLALAIKANLAMLQCADGQIDLLEKAVLGRVKLKPEYELLKTTPGIGEILSLTIMLETGDIGRFPTVGDYASYGRCVGSQKLTNGKKKGEGNTKNGNKYLAWAYVEAANFAVRFSAKIKSFHQRKKAKTNGIVAIKAVAHKLSRACYYIRRDQVAFDVSKAFG